MEKLHRMATALVLIFFYLEIKHLPEASALFISDAGTYEATTSRQFFCGEALTNTLDIVCKGAFNHMYKKNSGEEDLYPFTSRHLAKALIPGSFRRRRRGVVEECCKKPCTMAEMLSYCAKS